jgi:hypothetical protein
MIRGKSYISEGGSEWILGFVSKRVEMILHVCYDMKPISQPSLSELFLSLASLNCFWMGDEAAYLLHQQDSQYHLQSTEKEGSLSVSMGGVNGLK